jgi:hypothetical protein
MVTRLDAQPFTWEKDIIPVKLEFHKFNPAAEPKAKGKLNVTEITQVKDTLYFYTNEISIYSPVYVGITTTDKENPLEIRLAKMNWKTPDRKGSTGSSGHWEEKFKTETDFGIMVIAKNKPASYSLVVWNGDEVNFEMPPVFNNGIDQTATVKKGGEGFFKKNLMYIVIGLLVIVIGFLVYKLKNKKA